MKDKAARQAKANATMRSAMPASFNRLYRDNQYLPKFRARHKEYPAEFEAMCDYVEKQAAKGKIRNAKIYLDKIFSKEAWNGTIKIARTLMARIKSALADAREGLRRLKWEKAPVNEAGRERLAAMKQQLGVLRS